MKTTIKLMLALTLFISCRPHASGSMKIEAGGPGKIVGSIRNAATGQPLKYADVTIFTVSDSLLVAGTITNSDGQFILSMLAPGNYILVAGNAGFEKQSFPIKIEAVHPKTDIGLIRLEPDSMNKRKH